ncbi:MAG: hypothetical protein JXQ30_17330 [Spirochaetes bacterium]|nr:hypothetical protein [Spirochaetota bacterium]
MRFDPKALVRGLFACVFLSVMIGGATSLLALGEDVVPYPTLINASYVNGAVQIDFDPVGSETDCPGSSVSYRIYRSNRRMTEKEDLHQAVVVLEIGAYIFEENVPYRDTPQADGAYYYAVTVLHDGGEKAALFPYQNTTMYPVEYAPLPGSVSGISISAIDRTTAVVSFSPLTGRFTYSLFQSDGPFRDTPKEAVDTGSAFTVSKTEEDRFKVPITEETPYYFLVTTANRMGIENDTVVPGENTNIEPFLLRKAEEKKQATVKTAPVKPRPDTASALIERTLRRYFYRGLYTEAMKNFDTILKRRDLSPSQRGKSYFYMGQCCYYSRTYEKAIRYFILCKSTGKYAKESELWIERCLKKVE